MRVVAIVPLPHASRLERALAGVAELENCSSLQDCARTVERHRPHAIVADPALLEDDLESLVTGKEYAGISVVFYLRLEPTGLAAILPLVSGKSREILVAGIDDSDEHIRAVISRLPRVSLQARLFGRSGRLLLRVRPAVATALAVVVLDPKWSSTKRLPSRIGLSRRTIDRSLQVAGLAPLQQWSYVARLARAIDRLQRRSGTEYEAARVAGYSDGRALRRACRHVLGLSSADLRQISVPFFLERAIFALHGARDTKQHVTTD